MTHRVSPVLLGLLPLLLACGDGGQPSGPSDTPVSISTSSLPDGSVGSAYSASFAAIGGTGSHAWSLEAGSLPAGLSLSVSGAITGTPTTAGTSAFTVRATSGSASATRGYAINILPPGIEIATTTLPGGLVGSPYIQNLTASGGTGTYAWSLSSGVLPAGLSLSGPGVISGTPTTAGTGTFTVQASSGGRTATRVLTLTIGVPALAVTTTALGDAVVGAPYSENLAAIGGTGGYSWSLAGGSLPPGLSLSAVGAITGTPTAGGVSSFTVRVTSGAQQASRPLTVTVLSPSVSITTASLPTAFLGEAYSQQLGAIGGDGSYAWTLAGGALPAGLALSAAGFITGTPTATGTSSFTVRVASGSQTAALALAITVQLPPVSVTTATLPDATLGVAYSQQLAASGGTGAYTWTVSAGTLPPGLTLSAGGLLAGTPTAPGSTTFTVRAASGVNAGTRELTLTVAVPAVVITTTTLPEGTVGQAYNQALVATGGNGTFTWSITTGSLPAGLTLSPDGTIAGTPTASGSSTFTVRAASAGQEATKQLAITIGPALPAVVITTTTVPDAVVGRSYSQKLAATGGDGSAYSWSIASGQPPAGMTLLADGTLTGTPTSAGSSTFTVQATSGGLSGTRQLTVTVEPQLAIATTTLPDGTAGTAYSQTLAASGGAGASTWTVSAGTLPAGLALSAAGVLAGTPTTAGTSNFSVRVASGVQADTQALSLRITWPPVTITTTSLPDGTVGTLYRQRLTASGGDGTSYTWSITSGALPAGLTLVLDSIRGTPTAPGTATFTVQATSGGLSASRQLSIVVAGTTLNIGTATLPDAVAGLPYSQALSATGGDGAYTWTVSAGTLPAGLVLSGAGLISGTPASAGTSTFTAQVASAGQTDTQELTLKVEPPLAISTDTLPKGTAGTAYSATLAATGGGGTYTWSVAAGQLPAGLALSAAGVISGTPTTAGSSNFTVRVVSGVQTVERALSILVTWPPVNITTTTLPNATVGVGYSQRLSATGGDGISYTWSVTTGGLPAGLLLKGDTIKGTPTDTGTSAFTVQATSGGLSDTQALSIRVTFPPVAVSTTGLPDAVVARPYTATLAAAGGDGTYSWSLAGGTTLPAGLALSAAGVISGTPTVAGSSSFTVQVASGGTTATRQLTLVTEPVLDITTTTLPQATTGTPYSQALSAIGGGSSYTWSLAAGSLPSGLSLASTGVISGTPTATDTSSFSVRVSSGVQADTQALTLEVVLAPPQITTAALADAVIGTAYTQTLTASGGDGTYAWKLAAGSDSLPVGITLSGTGVISGTATAPDTANLIVQVTSAGLVATRPLTLTVKWPPVTITTASPLPNATRGALYTQTLAATGGAGTGTYTWTVAAGSTLPNWLSLSTGGVLSGTAPNNQATYNFTLQAVSGGQTGSKAFVLQVR